MMDEILPELRIGADTLHDLDRASGLEWLETNGLGGFASGTAAGLNTRRYHSLLTAALNPPAGRAVLINKLEETIVIDGASFALGVNRFPGAVAPQGHLLLHEFRLDPLPRWIYRIGGVFFEKLVFMVHGQNAAAVRYRWLDARLRVLPIDKLPPAAIRVRPFVSFRDYHALSKNNAYLDATCRVRRNALQFKPYEPLPVVTIMHDDCEFDASPGWYFNFEYEQERRRGLDYQDDLFTYGELVRPQARQDTCFLLMAGKTQHKFSGGEAGTDVKRTVELLLEKELTRRRRLLKNFDGGAAVRRLALAADQFIVSRGKKSTVIAGYPWFTDWGRDTMIALPGLTLCTGRAGEARDILSAFASFRRHGLLPNTFPDAGMEPSFNSVDATLWFFAAAHEYAAATGDTAFLDNELLPVFEDIIAHFERGTMFDIRVDGDGLVTAGGPDTQLTWMDARVDGVPVTPRYGKVVEINCLWHNALRITAECLRRAGRDAGRMDALAARARDAFARTFWNPDRGCLFDVINDRGADPAVRPNQVFALCLPYPLLDGGKAVSVLRVIEETLLIPYGLRSLEPGHPAYCGVYEGSSAARDAAYHQGTAWGWLLGPYVRAALRVRGDTPDTRAALAPLAAAMRAHVVSQAGLNSVSELFQSEPPHAPDGCPAQAWSVAEWLRALLAIQNPEV